MADAWVSLVLRTVTEALRERTVTGNRGKGITFLHWEFLSSEARWRWRRVGNPVHAALIQGMGHKYDKVINKISIKYIHPMIFIQNWISHH